ncbi:MAG: ribonuclease J, partial [Clostridiales bacterium]|nr:ribonuclease J [Clostridiales bacterium]
IKQSDEIVANPQKGKKKGKKGAVLKVLFFGGVGEIGKNMTALEYGNDIIIIDAGIIFPTEEMPGIDLVFPDITYLVKNKNKIRGVFLTHGHEDHIGGVPYLMKEINQNTPIYGTKLTLALVDNKLREHRLNNLIEKTVSPKEHVKAGVFTVNFVNVNHSIAGALAFAIETPLGIVFHSGDFKIDLTPVAGSPIDLEEIAQYGKRGVLLYLGESTNVERPGYTMSEKVVGTTLEHLFAENADRRLIIATFASNVHRLQQIIDIAVKYRRKVALSGRSMFNVVEAAVKIGELKIPEGVLVDVEKTKNFFDREIVIVSTGSQGEPMSALTRMASGDFNRVTIGNNDTIIISANPIPGNERMIYRVINNLYKKGANVVYESLEKIHVSGHACQEE